MFASDGVAAVLRVLRESGEALTAGEVKEALRAHGVPEADAAGAWPAIQKAIRAHDGVEVENRRYRWVAGPAVSPVDALELIVRGGLAADKRKALAAVIRSALASAGTSRDREDAGRRRPARERPARERPAREGTSRERQARERQAEIDAVRRLAELAAEVEELTANEVDADVMIRQVRAWAKRSGLEPIDRAGDETTFDRKRHKAIGPPIVDGAPVVVVRPGYVWRAPTEDVLIGKAVVEE